MDSLTGLRIVAAAAVFFSHLAAPPTDGWYGWLFVTGLQFGVIMLTAVGAHIVIERPAQQFLRRALARGRPKAIPPEPKPRPVPAQEVARV